MWISEATVIQLMLHSPKETLHWLEGGPGLEWLRALKGSRQNQTRIPAEGKGQRYRKKGGVWWRTGLDESLQCCRKISGTDHPILSGLFTLQYQLAYFHPPLLSRIPFHFLHACCFYVYITAFSPLTCLSFSLCCVGHTIRCFFIAKCLPRFDSDFCSGRFRLLLTLLLLRVSLTMEICTSFSRWQPPALLSARERRGRGCRGEPAHRGIATVRSPAARTCRAGEQDRGSRPSGAAASGKPTGEPCCSQLPPKIPVGQHRTPQSPRLARAALPPALTQSWKECCPPPAMARTVPGISAPSDHAVPPRGRHLPVRACPSSLRTQNRHSLSQKSIWAKEKSFGLEETSRRGKGKGFYSTYFSNIALPFCGLAETAPRAIIEVFKQHLSLLKQS